MPAMQPANWCAGSNSAAFDSVICAASVRSEAGRASRLRCILASVRCSTARRVQHAQCPSKPPANRSVWGLAVDRDLVRRQEVEQDVVVVAGVERDLVGPSGLRHGAEHVERLVPVERRDFDGDDVRDLGERAPEIDGQHPPTDGRLEVEPDERDRVRHLAAVRDEVVERGVGKGGEGEEAGVIAEVGGEAGLVPRLLRIAADRRRCAPSGGPSRRRTRAACRRRGPARAPGGRRRARGSRTASCARRRRDRPLRRRGSTA